MKSRAREFSLPALAKDFPSGGLKAELQLKLSREWLSYNMPADVLSTVFSSEVFR
jgi:hypothetical protein